MIQIDIDADLMLVDDDDRYIGRPPVDAGRLHVGGVALAGRPGGYTWALIEEITDDAVYFRPISEAEATRHGALVVAARG